MKGEEVFQVGVWGWRGVLFQGRRASGLGSRLGCSFTSIVGELKSVFSYTVGCLGVWEELLGPGVIVVEDNQAMHSGLWSARL